MTEREAQLTSKAKDLPLSLIDSEVCHMRHSYATKGTCSRNIEFDIKDGVVKNICFEGGCHGNLQGLARLAEGRRVEELAALLSGVKCGDKKTSCPDQLAKALKKHIKRKP